MKAAKTAVVLSTLIAGAAFADQPDKFVRYVESDGTQYVDTGVTGRWNTRVEAQVEWLELGDKCMLGAGDWSDNTRCFMIYCNNADGNIATALGLTPTSSGRVAWRYDNGTWNSWWQTNRIYDYSAEFSATNSAGECTRKVVIDGIKFDDITAAAVNSGYDMYIFGLNKKGTLAAQAKARIYRMKIWQGPKDGGDMTLVRDLIPCMKNGRAGLWDAVSGNILYSGSGTDLVCDENSNIPDEFVEYVESTGVNFIDTEVAARAGTEATLDIAILNRKSLDKGILEAYNGDLGNDYARYYLAHSYRGTVTCGYGTHKTTGAEYAIGERSHIVSSLAAGAQILTLASHGSATTNTIYSATDATAIDTKLPLYLFACNKGGDIDYGGQYRLYGLTIRQDGALVRDFRPCLKDGAFALYDAVSQRIFHPRRGLLNGPLQTTANVKVRDVIFVEYIESSGNETLDTGVRARAGTRAKGDFCWTEDFSSLTKRYEIGRFLKGPVNKHARTYLGADDPSYWPSFFDMVHAEDQRFAGYYGNGLGDSSVAYFAWAMDGSSYIYAKTPLKKHSFDASFMDGAQTITLDGTQVWSLSNDKNYNTGRNLHLFSSGSRYRSAARCYGLEIWQDGEKVRDFKPCIYQGKAMLYDTVSKCVFRPSPDIPASKTGSIILSGEEKPACYVDYIESDGTIFVDTGVTGKSGTKADLKLQFKEKADKGFLDSRTGDSRFYLIHNGANYNVFYIGYGKTQSFSPCAINTDYTVQSELSVGRQEVTVDGVSKWTTGQDTTHINPSDNINTGYNLYLFAMNQDGSPTYAGKARLYYLKLYQGDSDGSNMKLVRNLKPVRLTNGLVVLWDFVEKKAYLPQLVSSPGTYTQFPDAGVGPDGEKIRAGLILIVR